MYCSCLSSISAAASVNKYGIAPADDYLTAWTDTAFKLNLLQMNLKLYISYLNKGFPIGGNSTGRVLQYTTVVFPYPWEKKATTNIYNHANIKKY